MSFFAEKVKDKRARENVNIQRLFSLIGRREEAEEDDYFWKLHSNEEGFDVRKIDHGLLLLLLLLLLLVVACCWL